MTLRLSTVRKWIVYLLVVYVFFYPHITIMLGGTALYPILFSIIGLSLLAILHGMRCGIRMSPLSIGWSIILVLSLVRNHGIMNGSYLWPVAFTAAVISMIALGEKKTSTPESWPNKLVELLCFCSIIYIVGTILFFAFPQFFDAMVSFWGYYPNGSEMGKYGCRPGLADNHSANGSYCVIFFLIAGARIITNTLEKKEKKKNILFFLLSIAAVLLTTKRAHLIFGFGVLLVVYYFFSPQRKTGKVFKLLSFVVVVLIIFEIVKDMPVFSELLEGFNDQGGDISNGRYMYWLHALQLFSKNKLFGIGWLGFRFNSNSLIQGTNTGNIGYVDAHNVYVQLLCEVGIVGALFVIFVFVYCLISTIQTYKKYKNNIDTNQTQILAISVALQTFCLVYGLTGNFLYDRVFFVYSFGIVLYSYTANALLRERENRQ